MSAWLYRKSSPWFVAILAAMLGLGGCIASEPDTGKGESGVISGTVTYQPDSKRPWRYGRYYLKQGKGGLLAEALVCLSGKGLEAKKGKPRKWRMDQKNFEYLPEVLAIQAGDEVEFLNSDQALHNVAAIGGKDPFNIMTPVGKSLTRGFSSAGNEVSPIDISCGLHSQMHAWIYVFDHPFATVTKADGKFEFLDVPPGKYELVVIHPSGGLRKSFAVSVTKEGSKGTSVVLSPDDLLKKGLEAGKAKE